VARIGGDEFVVVLEDVIRPGEAAKIASKIVERLGHPFEVLGHTCTIGASVGIALYPDDGSELDEVFKAADIAMYKVKNSGRNGYALYGEMAEQNAGDADEA
jgi:diguanylate cyclase (GGDEF)-like protein